ncbi:MAG: permease-like cell division protein FtsX [Phaeodactylibacter sp.]|uniref:cell division protein FtsX n=1 Tax=Phaeodactylibacter sp. TaxID=1940289 RepID=UPI0032EB68A1
MPGQLDQRRSKSRPNYWHSIISVALVLFALGFFALTLLNAQLIVNELKEKVNLIIELQGEDTDVLARQILKDVDQMPFVREGSAAFISKEQGAALMREDFGDDFLKLDLPNPLYDVITFNVKAAYMHADSLKEIRRALIERKGITDVYYQESLVNDIADNIKAIGIAAMAILALFLIVAGLLIHNTVRLALYANRLLIKNMELVGATWEFISQPFLRRAMLHGLLSGALASGALLLLYLYVQADVPGLRDIQDWTGMFMLFGLLLTMGMFINTLSTYWVVRKYLKMRVDDLY